MACWLTTASNPYNPFTRFDEWDNYDCHILKLNTKQWLTRGLEFSQEMTPQEREDILEAKIDDFVATDPLGLYFKVYDDDAYFESSGIIN